MTAGPTPVDRALAAIGTTFRLVRLYPSSHPAVIEAMRHIAATLPALAALGSVEWKLGPTGIWWNGVQVLPRNPQVAELAGLLFVRGARVLMVHPGLTPENVLALYAVAMGTVPLDDATLGRLTLMTGRRKRGEAPPEAAVPAPDVAAPAVAEEPAGATPAEVMGRRPTRAFRPDAMPPEVEARRLVTVLRTAKDQTARREAAERLRALAPEVVALREIVPVAEILAGLDAALAQTTAPELMDAIAAAGAAIADPASVDRMISRLGEPRVPPAEREALVRAVGALGAVTAGRMIDAFLVAPADLREPYRAAVRAAAERAIEPLAARLAEPSDEVVSAAAQFLGLTGSPAAMPHLAPLVRHGNEVVREAALLALAEIGGREIQRPAMPALKDESALVRTAAARAIAVGGDAGAATVLIRRLDQEEDEGVQAEILKAIGRLGAREGLEILARFAEPGGRLRRRSAFVRAAAIDGLGRLSGGEARALLELYRHDKEPEVQRAADSVLR